MIKSIVYIHLILFIYNPLNSLNKVKASYFLMDTSLHRSIYVVKHMPVDPTSLNLKHKLWIMSKHRTKPM